MPLPPAHTRWQKGQSGNPGGKPRELVEVQRAAREHTLVALNTLVEVASNSRAAHAARVSAATALLDRGWGRPAQQVDLNASVEGSLVDVLASLAGATAAAVAAEDGPKGPVH